MYVAMGQGQIIPLGSNFDQTQEAFITSIISCKFQENLLNLRFYIDFIKILCIM